MVWGLSKGAVRAVFSRRMLTLIATGLFIYGMSRGRMRLHWTSNTFYAWGLFIQSIVGFVIVGVQRVVDILSRRGKTFAVRLLLVPVFEVLLLVLTVFSLCDWLIVTEGSQEGAPFLRRASHHQNLEHKDLALLFIHLIFFSSQYVFVVYFFFADVSLSRTAIARAWRNAIFCSVLLAVASLIFAVLGSHFDEQWLLRISYNMPMICAFFVHSWLLVKKVRSSRTSVVPLSMSMCLIALLRLTFAWAASSHVTERTNNLCTVFLPHTLFNVMLYWTLIRDSQYWRGMSHNPIWRSFDFGLSPEVAHMSLQDSLIERELPLLFAPACRIIDFAFLRFGPVIGTGSTCRVFAGEVCVGSLKGHRVAIKVFTPPELTRKTVLDFVSEIQKCETLRHPRVMELLGVCVCPPNVCMVCELCEGGSLSTYLSSKPLSTRTKMNLSIEVCEAICFIHSLQPPLLHRDIKSQNFLVTAEGHIKLSDFGTSVILSHHARLTIKVGSLHWMSPEMLSGSAYGLEADIHSLGVVLWEIWSQQTPYGTLRPRQIITDVLAGSRLPRPQNCPQEIWDLITSMWAHKPQERPSADEVLDLLRELGGGGDGGDDGDGGDGGDSPVKSVD